jgi:hypothetical protein
MRMPWDEAPAGRAWEPYQKKVILDKLLKLWLAHPEFRLGQLIGNAYDSDRLFTEEDWPFIEWLGKVYGEKGEG